MAPLSSRLNRFTARMRKVGILPSNTDILVPGLFRRHDA
jgi:hypothetical protein